MNFFKYHSNYLIVAHNFIISLNSILTCCELGWNHYAMNLWIYSNISLKYNHLNQNNLLLFIQLKAQVFMEN
jgi:hypothetical protein